MFMFLNFNFYTFGLRGRLCFLDCSTGCAWTTDVDGVIRPNLIVFAKPMKFETLIIL